MTHTGRSLSCCLSEMKLWGAASETAKGALMETGAWEEREQCQRAASPATVLGLEFPRPPREVSGESRDMGAPPHGPASSPTAPPPPSPPPRVRKQVVNIPSFIVRLTPEAHRLSPCAPRVGGGRPGRVKEQNAKKG